MAQYIDKAAVVAEIERRKRQNILNEGAFEEDIDILSFLNSLEVKEVQEEPVSDELERVVEEIVDPTVLNAYGVKEIANRLRRTMIEPVSEDLEEAIDTYLKSYWGGEKEKQEWPFLKKMVIYFAKWQKQNLWKPADGEDLPEIDREVIVLVDNFGKLIPKLAKRTYHLIENFVDEDTGEIISIENIDEVGDVINWTEPAIYWLDVDIPKLEED